MLKMKIIYLWLLLFCVLDALNADSFRSEIQVTTEASLETSTKKSGGFFGGFKKFFGGGGGGSETVSTTTTTPPITSSAASPQKPPPLVIPKAPLMPLGPRPDTPSTSPLGEPLPLWPQPKSAHNTDITSTTTSRPSSIANHHPQLRPTTPTPILSNSLHDKFDPYQRPRAQPPSIDLSYGGSKTVGGRPAPIHPTSGLAPITSTTPQPASSTTSATTIKSTPKTDFKLSGDDNQRSTTTTLSPRSTDPFPALPPPRRPSSPIAGNNQPTPISPSSPTGNGAWNRPLNIATVTTTTMKTPSISNGLNTNGDHGVSFVPHKSDVDSVTSTTSRPGFSPTAGNNLATDDEIRTLTENLYAKEINSQLAKIQVNPQGRTRSIDSTDEAPKPLMEIDPKVWENPILEKMRLLFNNYETDTMVNEHVTANERKEENDFLDAVMSTSVMRQAMIFLQSKGLVGADPKTHRDLLRELWFTQYSRGNGKIGSSGFEHVFVHEVKNGTIIGLHNWVYFHEEEKAGRLDYKGYLKQLELGTKGKVMKVRFTHNGHNKPVNTLFIGTSPELELALYTVCFQLRPDRTCSVSLRNNRFGIVTYSWRYRGKNLIGSAFPEI